MRFRACPACPGGLAGGWTPYRVPGRDDRLTRACHPDPRAPASARRFDLAPRPPVVPALLTLDPYRLLNSRPPLFPLPRPRRPPLLLLLPRARPRPRCVAISLRAHARARSPRGSDCLPRPSSPAADASLDPPIASYVDSRPKRRASSRGLPASSRRTRRCVLYHCSKGRPHAAGG